MQRTCGQSGQQHLGMADLSQVSWALLARLLTFQFLCFAIPVPTLHSDKHHSAESGEIGLMLSMLDNQNYDLLRTSFLTLTWIFPNEDFTFL